MAGAPARRDVETDGLHPLAGFASADDSARLVRNYRYAVERMMRILGGWIALTPELSAKLLFGRHVWDNAQHADALGKRLPELRSLAQQSEPGNGDFVAFMDAIEEPERPDQTIERVTGVYRVLKPHLIATYEDHLRRVNSVYEPPTERILTHLLEDERRHAAAGATILRHLASTPALAARADAWQAKLETLLAAAGGVTGSGLPAPASAAVAAAPVALNDDPQQFIRLEQSLTHWPMPEALEHALSAFGAALVAADGRAIAGWLAPEVASEALGRLTSVHPARHSVVAFAKIGERRVAKIRLEDVREPAPGGTLTLLTRWAPTADGWRAEAIDIAGFDAVRLG